MPKAKIPEFVYMDELSDAPHITKVKLPLCPLCQSRPVDSCGVLLRKSDGMRVSLHNKEVFGRGDMFRSLYYQWYTTCFQCANEYGQEDIILDRTLSDSIEEHDTNKSQSEDAPPGKN